MRSARNNSFVNKEYEEMVPGSEQEEMLPGLYEETSSALIGQ